MTADETKAVLNAEGAGPVNPGFSLSRGDLINDRYRIGDLLGKGGFGVVYAAHDQLTDSDIALKFLFPDLGGDPERVRRIQREILTARKVRDPRLVSIYDLEIWKGIYFISMERVYGRTLGQGFDQEVEWSDFQPIFLEICGAIAALHDQGIVHRDLKPGNIMITDSGSVKVLDFGLAKDLNTTDLTLTGSQILGSPLYLAPEQISGEGIDHRCDIYALGLIMFRVLTGINAFSESDKTIEIIIRKLKCDIPRWPGDLPAPPTVVKHILAGCLQRKPSGRFETIQALIKAVDEQKVGFWSHFRRAAVRMRKPLLTLAGLLLVLLLIIVVMRSKIWLGLTEVRQESQEVGVRNALGVKLWSHTFPDYRVIHTTLLPQAGINPTDMRRNHGDGARVIAYLSPIRDSLLEPGQSIDEVRADNRLAWFDERGRLLADRSLIEYFSFNTLDFARAYYFDSIVAADRDGDDVDETLAVLCHKNSMYPAALLFEDGGLFHSFSSNGHISRVELLGVDENEWRFRILSMNNSFMHMCQLTDLVFDRRQKNRGTQMVGFPHTNQSLTYYKQFFSLLPKVATIEDLGDPNGATFPILMGDRRLTVLGDGTHVLRDGDKKQIWQEDSRDRDLLFSSLNTFYVQYHMHGDREKGLSALMAVEKMTLVNPFVRALVLYFRAGVLMDQGQYRQAETLLHQALELYPEADDPAQRLCEIPFLSGKPLEAIRRLDESFPQLTCLWGLGGIGRDLFLAYCRLQAGQFTEAEAALSKILKDSRATVNKPYLLGLLNLVRDGDLSQILGQKDRGLGEKAMLVTLQEFRLLLARALLLEGEDLERSDFYFNDIYRNSLTRHHMTRVSLAWLADRKGNPQALTWAREGLAAMVERSRGDFETRFWLFYDAFLYAELMEKAGQAAEADRAYTLCVDSAPHSHLAGLALKRRAALKVDG